MIWKTETMIGMAFNSSPLTRCLSPNLRHKLLRTVNSRIGSGWTPDGKSATDGAYADRLTLISAEMVRRAAMRKSNESRLEEED